MTVRPSAGWRVERDTGTAAALLAPWPPLHDQGVPLVRVGRVSGRPALVVGSTQTRVVVDRQAAEAEAIDVRRRTTGGGAVLVAPDAQVWLDLWVPRSHALWDDDVVRSALWLGEAWRGALEGLGAPALEIHRRPLLRRAWSDLVCFAGLGPGEVYLAAADPPDAAAPDRAGPGAKVMGLAQRRTRAGARFHTSAVLLWEPTPLLRLLKADPGRSSGGDATGGGGPSWASVARGLRSILPTGTGPLSDVEVIARVEDAVLGALP